MTTGSGSSRPVGRYTSAASRTPSRMGIRTFLTTRTSGATGSDGPSITPRPPQGQPIVSALAHRTVAYRLLARSADLGFVTPQTWVDIDAILQEIRAEQAAAGRADDTVHVLGDVLVFLDEHRSEF